MEQPWNQTLLEESPLPPESEDDLNNLLPWEPPQESKKEKSGFGVLSMQLAICILAAIIILFCKLFFADGYQAIVAEYQSAFQADIHWNETMGQVQQTFGSIMDKMKPIQRDKEASSQNAASSEVTSSGEESSQPAESSQEAAGGEQTPVSETAVSTPTDATLQTVAYPEQLTPPIEGKLTSAYGFRAYPLNGEADFHKGIDIAADEGTKIKAAIGGTVETASYSDSYGNYLTIQNDHGFTTWYAHCKKLLVSEGDKVKQGKKIALVGSTGDSTGAHLHFAMQKDGIWVNPLDSFSENTYAAV